MILFPKLYYKSVKEITIEILKKNNIKALILDVDNTLIDFNLNMPENIDKWCNNLKKEGIKFIIVSNTNNLKKVKSVAEKLDIEYIYKAMKPLKRGFIKAQKILDIPAENIATVGDQIFTDVFGGNLCKMFPILVEPIDKKDLIITRIKRPLENLIIKKYLNTIKK